MKNRNFELGTMREALELIASKGWLVPPSLTENPLLIVRASNACEADYSIAELENLYGHLKERRDLPSFKKMTAEDFLDALHPASLVGKVA